MRSEKVVVLASFFSTKSTVSTGQVQKERHSYAQHFLKRRKKAPRKQALFVQLFAGIARLDTELPA